MGRVKEHHYKHLAQLAKMQLRALWEQDYPVEACALRQADEDGNDLEVDRLESVRDEYVEESLDDCVNEMMDAECVL